MSKNHSETAIIRIHCPDQRGIVARVTDFIHRNNGNIVALDQHTDRDEGRFFMRVEWELQNFELERDQIEPAFEFAIATPCKMKWKLHSSDHIPRMALFVSKMRSEERRVGKECRKWWRTDQKEIRPVAITSRPTQ